MLSFSVRRGDVELIDLHPGRFDIERMFDYDLGIMMLMERENVVEVGNRAAIGFALGDGPDGVAYVSVADMAGATEVVRVPFLCRAMPALEGRDVAYAAFLAVATELRRRGVKRVSVEIDAEHLVRDLEEHRGVPAALSVPYVMLGCALNRFTRVRVRAACDAACRDLTARARAEVSLHVAA